MVLDGALLPIVVGAAVSAALTAILCCFARTLGSATRLMDRPDGVRKTHDGEIPLIGGIALLLPSFAVSLCYGISFHHAPFIIVAIVTSTMMLLVGVADDRANLSPVWRFGALIFIIFVAFSLNPLFVLHTLKLGGFGYHIAISLDPLRDRSPPSWCWVLSMRPTWPMA
jgi:UDP-GlcNAc:undecaprenyl-phosphate/decaprenyl-phosphate GlcNAc-1-phosphate transferase